MAAFRALLYLGDKRFDVLQTEYEFSRSTDKKGRPSSNVYGGRIKIKIASSSDTSVIEAMLNSRPKPISGSVSFTEADGDTRVKELVFRNAYIVYFKEALDILGEQPMAIDFTLSAEEMVMGDANNNNHWPRV